MKTPVYFVIYHQEPVTNGFLIKHIHHVYKGYLEEYEEFYQKHREELSYNSLCNWCTMCEIVSRPDNAHLEDIHTQDTLETPVYGRYE